jgi:hypothetical protein
MARRGRNRRNTATAPEAPTAPQTDVQRAAASIRKRVARHAKLHDLDAGLPTPEQLAHGIYRTVKIKEPGKAEARLVKRNLAGRTIDLWLSRGMITDRQHRAAERYRADYEQAGLERSIISQYDGGTGSGSGTPNYAGTLPGTLCQMDARDRWRRARDKLSRSLVAAFDAIVLHDLAATDAVDAIDSFRSAGGAYASRFVPIYVRAGGDDLADWYGL